VINKVNNPVHLTLVRETKGAENDPGSSTGSGVAYERPSAQKDERPEEEKKGKPKLAIVSELEKAGMTEVIKDFYENKTGEQPTPQIGLTTRYQVDSSKTKGLLLNKKAE